MTSLLLVGLHGFTATSQGDMADVGDKRRGTAGSILDESILGFIPRARTLAAANVMALVGGGLSGLRFNVTLLI